MRFVLMASFAIATLLLSTSMERAVTTRAAHGSRRRGSFIELNGRVKVPKWKVTWIMEDSVVVPALDAKLAGEATVDAMKQHGVKIRLLSVEPVEEPKSEQA